MGLPQIKFLAQYILIGRSSVNRRQILEYGTTSTYKIRCTTENNLGVAMSVQNLEIRRTFAMSERLGKKEQTVSAISGGSRSMKVGSSMTNISSGFMILKELSCQDGLRVWTGWVWSGKDNIGSRTRL